jgi:hypothetical protein
MKSLHAKNVWICLYLPGIPKLIPSDPDVPVQAYLDRMSFPELAIHPLTPVGPVGSQSQPLRESFLAEEVVFPSNKIGTLL